VTEYLSGGNLTEFRRKNSLNMGQYIPKILTDILKALSYLKGQGIMHRDIKPENIVYRQEDDSWVLVDFGIAAHNKE
jgi:serine/threonine protein kinase